MTDLRELLREARDAAKDCSFIIAAWLSNPRERPDLESSARIALKRWLELEPKLSDAALARQRTGWVWVPEDATQAMCEAVFDVRPSLANAVWHQMVRAAPKPEEGPRGFNFEAADGEEGD